MKATISLSRSFLKQQRTLKPTNAGLRLELECDDFSTTLLHEPGNALKTVQTAALKTPHSKRFARAEIRSSSRRLFATNHVRNQLLP
jgi:hypothetical protein